MTSGVREFQSENGTVILKKQKTKKRFPLKKKKKTLSKMDCEFDE